MNKALDADPSRAFFLVSLYCSVVSSRTRVSARRRQARIQLCFCVRNTSQSWVIDRPWPSPFKLVRSRFESQVLPLKDATAKICQQVSSHGAIRNELQSLFGTAIAQVQLSSRQALIEHLAELGTVTRAGQDYVSFMPTGEQKAIRLKGAMFAADPEYARLRADHQNRPQVRDLT